MTCAVAVVTTPAPSRLDASRSRRPARPARPARAGRELMLTSSLPEGRSILGHVSLLRRRPARCSPLPWLRRVAEWPRLAKRTGLDDSARRERRRAQVASARRRDGDRRLRSGRRARPGEPADDRRARTEVEARLADDDGGAERRRVRKDRRDVLHVLRLLVVGGVHDERVPSPGRLEREGSRSRAAAAGCPSTVADERRDRRRSRHRSPTRRSCALRGRRCSFGGVTSFTQ